MDQGRSGWSDGLKPAGSLLGRQLPFCSRGALWLTRGMAGLLVELLGERQGEMPSGLVACAATEVMAWGFCGQMIDNAYCRSKAFFAKSY
jgi:hypothetical protein